MFRDSANLGPAQRAHLPKNLEEINPLENKDYEGILKMRRLKDPWRICFRKTRRYTGSCSLGSTRPRLDGGAENGWGSR